MNREAALCSGEGGRLPYPLSRASRSAPAARYSRGGRVNALYDRLNASVKMMVPIDTKFYGMHECAIEDPDAHVMTFAQRTQG
jgi:hypothetical protein